MRIKWSCTSGSGADEHHVRHVVVNEGAQSAEAHANYLGNYTRTTKYTLLTFLPKALYEQVRSSEPWASLQGSAKSLTPSSSPTNAFRRSLWLARGAQYRRIANVYFTLVAALSLTEFSPVR